MRALELQQLVKRHISIKVMLNSEEIKPIALAAIDLHLSEGISRIVNQSVKKSVK